MNTVPEDIKTNVLTFPKSAIVRDPLLNTEEAVRVQENKKKVFATQLINELNEDILMTLAGVGMDIDNPTFIKDYSFLIEVLYATVFRSLDMEHEFQKLLDNVKIVNQTD